jgi:hypothetical protein
MFREVGLRRGILKPPHHFSCPGISVELVVFDLSQHYVGSIDERIRVLEGRSGLV